MNDINFQSIPSELQIMIDSINDNSLKKIYSQFNFKYLSILEHENIEKKVKYFLAQHLKNINFLTYQFSNHNILNEISSSIHDQNINKPNHISSVKQKCNIIICFEKNCLIIDGIDSELITEILNDTKSILIKTNQIQQKSIKNEKLRNILEEIDSFCSHFEKYINNQFLNETLRPIACFLIRRFFYPSYFYDDPSFFLFRKKIFSSEEVFKRKMLKIFQSKNVIEMLNEEIEETFKFENDENPEKNSEFKEEEFIVLRYIRSNNSSLFKLVFHVDSLHIFLLKQFDVYSKYHQREIEFCSKYSHRCLVKCYGVLKENKNIIGIIYEFMCNGDLKSYIEQNTNEIDQAFSFNVLMRIFQGIQYLHSKSLIHRDLKPLNILLDHDLLPYISDYETIKKINEEEDDDNNNDSFSYDFGSPLYESPEQFQGNQISFPTDIFSLGLIIYFLYEHKDLITNGTEYAQIIQNKQFSLTKIKNCTKRVETIFSSCIILEQDKRFNVSYINDIIFNEINSMTSLNELFKMKEKMFEIPQYLYENICILDKNIEQYLLIDYFYKSFNLLCKKLLFTEQQFKEYFEPNENIEFTNSNSVYKLGYLYENGYGVGKSYLKAKLFYEKAAKDGNSNALLHLGNLYRFGNGVDQNLIRAREYYIESSKLNNSEANYSLGHLYYNGYGVKKDFKKAIEYFQLAAEQNNTHGINMLGFMHENGDGIYPDAEKALKYYTLAYKLKNGNALNNIAFFYENCYFNCIDYNKSRSCFEKSARKDNANAYLNLGRIYEEGIGVKIDYKKAKQYYKQSSKLHHMDALFKIGDFCLNGKGGKINIKKAICYFQLSAELKNKDALYQLGNIFLTGLCVTKNLSYARKYYKLAAYQKKYSASYKLATIYIDGEYLPINIKKAIKYFELCIETKHENLYVESDGYYNTLKNFYCYPAYNELGIIYAIFLNDIKNAYENLNISKLNEYQLGQNNFGIFCQFFLNEDIEKVEDIFIKPAKKKFPLSEYNLGYIYEKKGDYNKSIKYYTRASKHENNKIIFHSNEITDKRLRISIYFIILYTDLKLLKYFLLSDNKDKSKYYFSKIIEKFDAICFKNLLEIQIEKNENIFIYIRELFFNFFLFDIKNYNFQSEVNQKQSEFMQIQNTFLINDQFADSILDNYINDILNGKNPTQFFEIIIENKFYVSQFLKMLQDLIDFISLILYDKPYIILFGKFPIDKKFDLSYTTKMKVNHFFYDGFGL